jgi:hypothetical protein
VSETKKERKEGRKKERVKALQGQTLQCERERERERKKREFCFFCFTLLLLLLAISLPLLLKVFYVLLQIEDVINKKKQAGLLLYLLRVFLLS